MTIGERIKEQRTSKKLSRAALALASGVSESAIKQYENGSRQPRIEQLQLIASALGVTVSFLLGYETSFEVIPGRLRLVEVNDPELSHMQYRIEAADEEAYLKGRQIFQNAGIPVQEYTAEELMLAALAKLNDKGKAVAVERVEELTQIPGYQRGSTTAK